MMVINETKKPESNLISRQDGMRMYLLWAMSRLLESKEKQCMPAFGGFISSTGVLTSSKTTIGSSINEPITEYSVVREVLKKM